MNRYPGTLPFTTTDKDIFFGREKEMAELYQLIRLEQLVVLYGKSGLGKSSLIQAGIIPKIQSAAVYQPIYIRFTAYNEKEPYSPTQITKDNLAAAFDQPTFLATLKKDENTLWSVAKNRQINNGGHRLVLLFDQFEELFQYPEQEVQTFSRQLRELLTTAIPQRVRDKVNEQTDDFLTEDEEDALYEALDIKVVFGIRSDRMHLLNKLARSLPQILANNYELQPLAPEDAKEAIVLPARKEGDFATPPFEYSEGSLAQILDFLQDGETGRVEAFQLQLLCQTFEAKVGSSDIRRIELTNSDNLQQIIDDYFQDSVNALPPADKNRVEELIAKELISPDGTVRYSTFEQKLQSDYHISDALLDRLINLRLLRRERTSRGVIYEISHDTFLKPAREIKSQREEAEQGRALAEAQAKAEAERQRAEEQKQLTAKAQEATKRASNIAVLAVIAALIAIGAGIWALRAQEDAARSEKKAKQQLEENIKNQTVAKAQKYINFAKSYESYDKMDFACNSYNNALFLIKVSKIKDYEALPIYQEIKQLKKQISCD